MTITGGGHSSPRVQVRNLSAEVCVGGSDDMTGQWDNCWAVSDYRVPFFLKQMASVVHSFPEGCGQQLDWFYLKKNCSECEMYG